MQDAGTDRVTLAMVTDALQLSGIELAKKIARRWSTAPTPTSSGSRSCARVHIPNDVSPPYHFSPRRAGDGRGQDAAARG